MGGARAVREGRWKLLRERENGPTLLFDLDQDAAEAHDLASAHPDRVRALGELLSRWETGLVPPRWTNVR
jgi:arylsulfatase A-like enzyme